MGRTADQVRSRLVRQAIQPLPTAEFRSVINAEIRQLLPFDGWCLIGLDPDTRLRTFQLSQNGTASSCTEALSRNEALMSDVNLFSDLATAERPAGWLSRE